MGTNDQPFLGQFPDFVKGMSQMPRMHMRAVDCMPNGRVPVEQVSKWPRLSLGSFKAFKKFTGLRFLDDTYLHREPGKPHIFAVNPNSNLAICVYRHTREF